MAMEAKGDQLVFEAEAALKKWSFFSGNDKFEDAAEKFQRAGHAFKAAKAWESAGKAYTRAAECFKKVKSESDIASSYIEAARAYVKAGDSKLATDLLENEALPRMVDAGRLSQAAKLHQEVAEMFEEEGNYAPAIDNFQKAADLFNADNSASTASKCISKVAHLAAQLDPPDYALSAEMFEKCGADSLSSNLLKFSAKGYFTNAVLAQLARDDVVTAELALGKYKDMDYTFPGSRECKLLDDLVQAVKDGNVEAFTDAIYNYDQISKLDPWKTSLLLKVKNNMSKGMGGASGGAGGEPDLT